MAWVFNVAGAFGHLYSRWIASDESWDQGRSLRSVLVEDPQVVGIVVGVSP